MRTTLLSIIMLAACATSAWSQEATPGGVTVVTLDDCRRMAVENNAKVAMATRSAEAAQQLKNEAFTKYFPTVQASATHIWSNKPMFHYDVLDLFTIEFLKGGFGAGITAVQPLFAGGRIYNGNRLAQVGVEASRLERQGAVDDVTLTAEEYYWQLVTLKSKRHTLESLMEMVDTLTRQVGVAVDAGVALRNDLLKVQLRRNELEMLMVDLDNGISLSSKLLAQYIGLDGQPIDIPDVKAPGELPPYPGDIKVDPQSALGGTTGYQLLDAQVRAADLKTKMAVGNYLPTVGLGAGYFYDDVFNQKYSFGALLVNVTVPISDWWGGSHAIKRSRLEAENARDEMRDLSQMLMLKMDNAWDDLTAAYRKMTVAHSSIEQSRENLRISRNYYDAGVSTITDLLDAQTLYRQACDNYTDAYGNFCLERARYLNATAQR